MPVDYLGNQVLVGGIMVYGAGRGAIEYGLVLDVEDLEGQENRWQHNKIKIARVERNRRYQNVDGVWQYVDYGGWKVKRITHQNSYYSVMIPDELVNDPEVGMLIRYRNEIVAGAKVVGNHNDQQG